MSWACWQIYDILLITIYMLRLGCDNSVPYNLARIIHFILLPRSRGRLREGMP